MKKMRYCIQLLLVLIFSNSGFANEDCTPNLIKEDMCARAKEMQMGIAGSLPQKVNADMTLTKVFAIGTQINFYVQFSYDQSYLESLAAGKISMEELLSKLKTQTQSVICKQDVTAAFVRLGGKINYVYSFSNGAPYSNVSVSHCEPA